MIYLLKGSIMSTNNPITAVVLELESASRAADNAASNSLASVYGKGATPAAIGNALKVARYLSDKAAKPKTLKPSGARGVMISAVVAAMSGDSFTAADIVAAAVEVLKSDARRKANKAADAKHDNDVAAAAAKEIRESLRATFKDKNETWDARAAASLQLSTLELDKERAAAKVKSDKALDKFILATDTALNAGVAYAELIAIINDAMESDRAADKVVPRAAAAAELVSA
jgi:hypothetical protein